VNNVIVLDSRFSRCLPYLSPRGRHFSNGLAACYGNKGAVESRSCDGLRACELNEGDVGNNSACTRPTRRDRERRSFPFFDSRSFFLRGGQNNVEGE